MLYIIRYCKLPKASNFTLTWPKQKHFGLLFMHDAGKSCFNSWLQSSVVAAHNAAPERIRHHPLLSDLSRKVADENKQDSTADLSLYSQYYNYTFFITLTGYLRSANYIHVWKHTDKFSNRIAIQFLFTKADRISLAYKFIKLANTTTRTANYQFNFSTSNYHPPNTDNFILLKKKLA